MEKWSTKQLIKEHAERIKELKLQGFGRRKLAKIISEETEIPCTTGVMQLAIHKLNLNDNSPSNKMIVVEENPKEEIKIPIDDLIKSRIEAYSRKKSKFSKHYRTIKMECKPFGIWAVGDPHVDSDGCDWQTLFNHIEIVSKTDGVLSCNLGDQHNNWVGRLNVLYQDQSMLVSDQWRLSEWMLKDAGLDWLFVIGGNHDGWAANYGHDPLEWLSKRCGVRFYAPDQLRLDIEWIDRPDVEPYKILSRHFFKGHSWFHPTHGSNKQAMLGNANLLLSGHIHTWGQLSTEQMHNRITHAISLRGYKKQDKYSVQKGFMNNQEYGESCIIIIDPDKEGPARTKVFWDIKGGCEYLTYLRSKYTID